MSRLDTLNEQLEELAYEETENFCYSCYKIVDGDYCPTCHSDDFMRHLDGVGVEYGTDWVIDHLITEACDPIDEDEIYDDMLDECYPDVVIGCCSWTASTVLKELDPTTYRVGKQEYFDSLVEDGELWESEEGEYYRVSDIETQLL